MFSKILSRLLGRNVSASSTDSREQSTALAEVTLPPRPPTKMEESLSGGFRASFDVINPSPEDLKNAAKLPPGSLCAIWTEFRDHNGGCVEATFVGHEAHSKAPYVLLRAKHKDLFLFSQVKSYLQEQAGVGEQPDSVNRDDVAVVIHFTRETGFIALLSDRLHFNRVAKVVSQPPPFVEEVIVSRLVLHELPVRAVAGVGRLGDQQYELSFIGSKARIVVERGDLAEAA